MIKEGLRTGGADRDRTDDLLNAIQALSQLSYGPSGARIVLSGGGGCQTGPRPGAASTATASGATPKPSRRASSALRAGMPSPVAAETQSAPSRGASAGTRSLLLNTLITR